MALMKGHEIATIDVELVTVKLDTTEIGLKTANKISIDPQIETTDAIKNIVKGVLLAQKREINTLTGNTITLTDNVFNPELVKMLQGGTIEYAEDGHVLSYTPPLAGSDMTAKDPFTLCVYTAQYDASGLVVRYEMTEYPNCTGQPVAMSSEDDVFRAPEYTIISAPAADEPPYKITYIDSLPTLNEWSNSTNSGL